MHPSSSSSSSAIVPSFFWKQPIESRGRFNLLLLEYGELFFEDLAVFYYPVFPNHSTSFAQCDAVKLKGRLKLCSRSLIFEPNDERKPLYKFAFKAIDSVVEPFHLRREEADECKSHAGKLPSGFLTFTCTNYAEMKENNHVGPYRTVDNGGNSTRFLFAIVHADMSTLLAKITNLRKGKGGIELMNSRATTVSLFNSSHLVDFHEILQFKEPIATFRVSPLLLHPGSLMITDQRIYFQPSQLNNVGDAVVCFDISCINLIYARRHLLRQRGLEIFFRNHGGSSSGVAHAGTKGPRENHDHTCTAYFVFDSEEVRDQVFHTITIQPSYPLQSVGISSRVSIVENMFRKWQLREVSNFDYLMFLNFEADRSLSDLAQYPVFPHVLLDYNSAVLDLTSPDVYRDLSKPVGALNPQRLTFFKERFEAMVMSSSKTIPSSAPSSSSSSKTSKHVQQDNGNSGIPPPFLYGTHYSTPGYVLYYLVRVAPEHMLCLSDGKFDAADRMFHSLPAMLDSCLNNPADLKELIPEFFCGDGDFLLNSNGLDLGRRQNGTGERIGDVELPVWAEGNPVEFIAQNRQALESEYVSAHLHEWIDLIFGYKQRGVEALKAHNLFYHLTYDHNDGHESPVTASSSSSGSTSMSLDTKQSQLEREARDVQVAEFGQIPKQLFAGPHPSRNDKTCGVLDFAAGITNKRITTETNHIVNHSNNTKNNETGIVSAAITAMSPPSIEPGDCCANNNSSSTNKNVTLVPSTMTAASPVGVVGVLELGDDFRAEVEQQMLLMSSPSSAAAREGSRLVVNMHAQRYHHMESKATTSSLSKDHTSATTAIPTHSSSSSSTPSLKNRMWGLVTDTAMVVADHVDKHKDRFPLQQLASRWQQPWMSSNKETSTTSSSQHSSHQSPPGQGLATDHGEDLGKSQQQQQQQSKATVFFHALASSESNTLGKLKAAISGVSAIRVSTMTTTNGRRERGVDKVVVSACAKDLSTIVVDCTRHSCHLDPIDTTTVVRSNFVAHEGMSGGGGGMEPNLALQMVHRVGSSLPSFLGNVVASPFLTSTGGGGGVTSSSCRLSVDGEHVLISAVKDLECSLYSYLLQPKGSATLEGYNVVSYDYGRDDGIGFGQRKSVKSLFGPSCVALGRGTQLLVSGATNGTVTLQPLGLRSPGMLPSSPSLPQKHDHSINQDLEMVRFTEATSPVTVVSLLLKPNNSNQHPSSGNDENQKVSSSSSSMFRGLYVAGGCEDGTVGVWDTDHHLPLMNNGSGKGKQCTCLFCHQLRPTERPIVCLEWLRMQGSSLPSSSSSSSSSFGIQENDIDKSSTRTTRNVSGGNSSTGHCVMLVTGASDGSIHIVDINRGGTVLAVFDCLSDHGEEIDGNQSPQLLSMAVSDVLTAPMDLALVPNTATASIFVGFSDGTIHVLGVHIGLDTTDCDHYEGVWKLAYVRLEPICVLIASTPGLSFLSTFPLQKKGSGITSLCWTQTPPMMDQPMVPAAATLVEKNKVMVWTKHEEEEDVIEETTLPKENHATHGQGTLISGHADGTIKSWEVTVYHRIESSYYS